MRVDAMFLPTGKKTFENCTDVYERGSYTCFQLADGTIFHKPTVSIHHYVHVHQHHPGTTKPDFDEQGREDGES